MSEIRVGVSSTRYNERMGRALGRGAVEFLVIVVFFGGLAYVGWHTSSGHNGYRTVGSAALVGVGFAVVFALFELTDFLWKRHRRGH
jgi:hypothetical protein